MPESWVEVANSALVKIGTGVISGFNSLNKAEKLTAERYEKARDIVLRLHLWNCAMTRVLTAPLSSPTPAFGYAYYHSLPTDCLRVVNVGPDGVDFKVEGRKLATDETELELKYIRREDDPTIIDVLCGECISLYLAWDLCEAFEQSQEKKDELWKAFKMMLPLAKSTDGKEDPTQELEANLWLDARLNGSGFDRFNSITS